MIVNTRENRYLTDEETELIITTVARGYRKNGKILPDLQTALIFYLNTLTGIDFYSNNNLKISKIKQTDNQNWYFIDDHNNYTNRTERFFINKFTIDKIIECENYLNNYIDNLVEVDEIVKRHEKFKEVCKYLEIKNVNYEALRRTFASNTFNEYESYEDVMEAMNFNNITETVEYLGASRKHLVKDTSKYIKSEKTHFLDLDLFSQ